MTKWLGLDWGGYIDDYPNDESTSYTGWVIVRYREFRFSYTGKLRRGRRRDA